MSPEIEQAKISSHLIVSSHECADSSAAACGVLVELLELLVGNEEYDVPRPHPQPRRHEPLVQRARTLAAHRLHHTLLYATIYSTISVR